MEQQLRVLTTRIRTQQILHAEDHQLGQLQPPVTLSSGPGGHTTAPADPPHHMEPDKTRAVLLSSPDLHRPTVLVELVTVSYGLAVPSPRPLETPEGRRAQAALHLLLPVSEHPDFPPTSHPAISRDGSVNRQESAEGPDQLLEDFTFREALDAFDAAFTSADALACCSECATAFFYSINALQLEALAKFSVTLDAIEAKAERDCRFSEELHAALGSGWVSPQYEAPFSVN